MYLSKLWLSLLVIIVVVVLGIAFVAPRPANRETLQVFAASLDRGQHNIDLRLRLEVHNWIETVTQMARDPALSDILEQASNKKGDIKQHQAKALAKMLTLRNQFAATSQPRLMIAVDSKGKQIGRIGPGEDKYIPGQDGLIGYPIVESVLRGLRGDDTWSLDNKLFFVVAAPAISRNKMRYVGALLLGHEVNDVFARQLKSRLAGLDVAFYLRGKLVGSTVKSNELMKLPQIYNRQRDQILKDGRSPTLRIEDNSQTYSIIMAPMPGEAREHNGFYTAIDVAPTILGLGDSLKLIRSTDFDWLFFPWLFLVGILIALTVISYYLLRWEFGNSFHPLLNALGKVSRHEALKVEETFIPKYLHAVARAINDALDKSKRPTTDRRKTTAESTIPSSSSVSQAEIHSDLFSTNLSLNPSGVLPLNSIEAHLIEDSQARSLSGSTPHLEIDSKNKPMFSAFKNFPASNASDNFPAVPNSHQERPSSVEPLPMLEQFQPSQFSEAANSDLLPSLSPPSSASLEPILPPPAELASASAPPARVKIPLMPETAPAIAPLSSQPSVGISESLNLPQVAAPKTNQRLSTSAAFELALKTSANDTSLQQERYWREIYADFLSIKKQCGESITNLTFERFAAKLQKNQDELIQRFQCKGVKFQVYIKEGKAALKATPIKD